MTLWTPTNLTTAPVEWFKGDAGITTSSGEVTAWAQQGSKTGGMTRPAGYTGPTTSTLNSLTTTVYAGTGSSIGLTTSATRSYSSGAMSVFILVKRTSGRTSTYDVALNTDVPWSSTQGLCVQYDTGTAGVVSCYGGNGYGGTGPYFQVQTLPGPATDGFWHTLEALWASTVTGYYDGNSQSFSASSGASFPALSSYLLDLGFNPDGNFLGGEIAEVIMLNYAPTTGERQQIEGYLAWKWGVTGSNVTDLVGKLPSGHPYKSAAPVVGGGISGTLSATEAADTISSAGNLKIQATASISEAADTLSSAAKLLINASASLTESADTMTSTGTLPGVTGTASITEEADFVTSAGALSLQGTAAISEGADVVSSTGTLAIVGTASISEAADTISASGVGAGRIGTASITEADDTLVSAAKLMISATASITEADDTATAAAALKIAGTLAYTEADDTTLPAIGNLLIQGSASISEGADVLTSAGVRTTFGTLSITEAGDTVTSAGGGTVMVAATGSSMSVFQGFPGFQYGWVQPATGSTITTITGHIDSRSWTPATTGTAIWVKVNA